MQTMREYLIEQLGQDCFDSRNEFRFQLPLESGNCEALFDPYNERLKVFGITGRKFRRGNLIPELTDPGEVFGAYSKLIIYAYPGDKEIWHSLGFALEGNIRGYFTDSSPAMIWTAYLDHERGKHPVQNEHVKIVETARAKWRVKTTLKNRYTCEVVSEGSASEVSNILKKLFKDYPTPISSRRIKELIRTEKSLFRCVRDREGRIVAIASAEIDHGRMNAELTDCATLPDERRKGHMAYILRKLERDIHQRYGIANIYTLARAGEPAINCTFAKLGYIYTGRLFNNCRMPDGWESMNIWCKPQKKKEKLD